MAKQQYVIAIIVTLIFLVISGGSNHVVNAGQEIAVVTANNLNVRSGPGPNHPIVSKVVKGDQLLVLEKKNDWYKVKDPAGKEGWVAGWLIKLEKASPAGNSGLDPSEEKKVVITDDVVNLRNGPGTNFSIVARLTKGDTVDFIKQQGDWYQVGLKNNSTGWVADWLGQIETTNAKTSVPTVENNNIVSDITGTAIVTGTYVNIRSGPGTDNNIIHRVHQGQEVTIISKQDDWYQVQLSNDSRGWVADWLVEAKSANLELPNVAKSPAGTATEKLAVILTDGVNVRTGPGTDFSILSKVNQGEQFKIIDQEQKWLQLELDNQQLGWVANWLVEVEENSEKKNLANSGAAEEQESNETKLKKNQATISVDLANVRSGPGTSFPILSKAKMGEQFVITDQKLDWFQLDLGTGKSGWIAGWLAEINKVVVAKASPDRNDQNPSAIDVEAGGDKVELKDRETVDGNENTEQVENLPKDTTEMNIPEHLSLIENFSLATSGNQGKITIKASKPIKGYNMFALREPNRVVLDIEQAFLTAEAKEDWSIGDTFITGVRYGQFEPEQVRVVIDLTEPIGFKHTLSQDELELTVEISSTNVLNGKLIVIDPGHGSINSIGIVDPGAIGSRGLTEREVVTDISHQLKKMLEAKGAKVMLTRTGNTTNLSLEGRSEMANNLGADIFVSVHANASLSPLQNGTSVFYHAPANSDLGSQRTDRRLLAQYIQDQLVDELKLRDMGIIEKNFNVLRHTKMPSVLVEVAFISNSAEEKLLASPNFRKRSAEAIMKGISEYFAAQ